MYRTFSEIKKALNNEATVESILEYYLKNIEERKSLNAFLEVFEDSARQKAKEVDEKLKNGTAGRLAGMIVGIKDNIVYKGHKVSAASKMLEGFESIYSSTVVERLLTEDAVIIGRLNSDEFSMGSANENSAFGPVKNPINEEYVPGGSSGGCSAAVAANLCTLALGSDTGGSVRQPASFTGTIGFKPTYGRISRHGLIAFASSFDQISPIANAIEDIALITEVLAGKDDFDGTLSSREVPQLLPLEKKKKLKLSYYQDLLDTEDVDPEIKGKFIELLENLKKQGHDLVPVSFPYLEQAIPTYYALTAGEASSNLSRYDGIHFGYRSEKAGSLEEIYFNSRTEGFGDEVKRRIMTGLFCLSRQNYNDYYLKAQKVRRLIQDETNQILATCDAIILPTTLSTAFKLNEIQNPVQMYYQDTFTVQANLTGHPAISIPFGIHSNKLPFGLQLIGNSFEEKELLNTTAYLIDFINDDKVS